MASRRVYTDADKARVKATLDGNQGNVKRTARDLALPVATVRTWKLLWEREGVPAKVQEALPAVRTELTENIDRVADKLLTALEEQVDQRKMNARDLITGFGVLTDKSRLIQGKPTSRTETDGSAVGNLPVEQVREMFAGFAKGIVEAAIQRDAAISSATGEETIDAEWSEPADPALTP